MILDQRHSGISAKIHVGLIDHDHLIGQATAESADGLQVDGLAGRRIGIRENHGTGVTRNGLQIQRKILVERHSLSRDAIELAIHRIKAVGDIRVNQRAAMVEQGLKGEGQDFVRAVAHKHMVAADPVILGNALAQCGGIRVRIEAQVTIGGGPDCLKHPRRRRVGALVGVEFDQLGDLGLLTRGVGGQSVDNGAPESAHAVVGFRGGCY